MHTPTLEEFRRYSISCDFVPVYRQLVSDTLVPVTAYCLLGTQTHSFLFESVVGGERVGRYSFLGANPYLQLDAYGHELVVTEGETETRREVADPLAELGRILEQSRSVHLPGLPRFCGGAVGYAGYDVVRYTERLPHPPTDDRHLPDLSFGLYDLMVVFDHINKTILCVAHADVRQAKTDSQVEQAYRQAAERVDALCLRLQSPQHGLQIRDIRVTSAEPGLRYESNFTKSEFEAAVETCKEHIRACHIVQVVISQRLQLETSARPLDIYRALRVVNPSPFMFLLQSPQTQLVGSSPEIMVRVEDGRTTIRPLAGTRKRGANAAEDASLAADLLADPKERAEHVMLIDLARNDVGRVAEFGSVELSDVMVVERYSHVMHITSNVTGQLEPGRTALDALRAGLPAGTVSGAPKVRAMEIIDSIEPHRRGPYAGAVGYFDFTGNMDTCIALRTLVMQGNQAFVQAGAGIVADSIPESEYFETLSKAKGLLKAIEIAEKQIAGSDNTPST